MTVDFSTLTGIGRQVKEFISVIFPYHEVLLDRPVLSYPGMTVAPLLPGATYKWVLSVVIRVRTMGTASYIRLGNPDAQEFSFVRKGQTLEWAGNNGETMDLAKMYTVSDTADAVLEIIAAYVPIRLIGTVLQAIDEP